MDDKSAMLSRTRAICEVVGAHDLWKAILAIFSRKGRPLSKTVLHVRLPPWDTDLSFAFYLDSDDTFAYDTLVEAGLSPIGTAFLFATNVRVDATQAALVKNLQDPSLARTTWTGPGTWACLVFLR